MKKSLLSCLFALPLAVFAQTNNLLHNGDFESVDHWNFTPKMDEEEVYVQQASHPDTQGMMYLKLKLVGSHTISYFDYEDESDDNRNIIPVVAGKKYKFSFWAKATEETDMMAGFTFTQQATKAKKGEEWPQFKIAGNDEWKQYTAEVACPSEADRAAFEFYFSYATATVCLDDVVLTQVGSDEPSVVPQDPNNVFAYGGFEDAVYGRLKGWYLGTADHTLITEGLHEGTQGKTALKIYPKSGNTTLLSTMNAGEANTIIVKPGTKYELSFWAKAEAADEKMDLYLNYYTNNKTDNQKHFLKESFTPSTAWKQYTFPVDVDEDTNSLSFTIDFKTSSGYLYFDDFELRQKDAPSALHRPTEDLSLRVAAQGVELQLERSQPVAIYNLSGQLLQRAFLGQGHHFLTLPAGLYVIKTQHSSTKLNIAGQ